MISLSKKLFLTFRILFGLVGIAFLYVALFDWMDGNDAFLACATDDCLFGLKWQIEAFIGTGMILVASTTNFIYKFCLDSLGTCDIRL